MKIGEIRSLEKSTLTAGRLFSVNDRIYESSGVCISVLHEGSFHYERKGLGKYYSYGEKCILLKEGKQIVKVKPDFTEEKIMDVDSSI